MLASCSTHTLQCCPHAGECIALEHDRSFFERTHNQADELQFCCSCNLRIRCLIADQDERSKLSGAHFGTIARRIQKPQTDGELMRTDLRWKERCQLKVDEVES